MAPGLGSTRDSGLAQYAERLAAAGLNVLLFDYRHFGDSSGTPRQLASVSRQHQDYRMAVAHARSLPFVDPRRIVLWGLSYSGGHVVSVGAEDERLAAVVSLVPAMDGRAIVAERARRGGVGVLLRVAAHGVRDLARAGRAGDAHRVPIAGPPGTTAAISTQDALTRLSAHAGPSWRNEIAARSLLGLGSYRPGTRAGALPCPLLVQTGDRDDLAPPGPAEAAAFRAGGRAEIRRYPIGHHDVYEGVAVERLVADQLHFLRRHLGGA